MKKLLFSLVLLICGTAIVSAQDFAKFRVGVTGGVNISSWTGKGCDNVSSAIGFQVGARGEYNFNNSLYLGAALLWDAKGQKYESAHYINLPVHFGYRYNFSEKWSVFGEVGPYFACGVAGEMFTDNEDVSRFDCGLSFRVGAEYKKIQFHVGYDYGLTAIEPGSGIHNSNVMVGLSYMF